MPSRAQIQAQREAEARKNSARTGLRLATREAIDAGLSPTEIAEGFVTVLREHGLLATADPVTSAARRARKG